MGFQLFTSSGTFNPASWGLKAGDILQIVCVGGGGGGSHANNKSNSSYNGKAGSASSFGSILSAAGGNGGVCVNGNTYQNGSNMGGQGGYLTIGGYTYYYGGSGGDGWLPGFFGSGGVAGPIYLPFTNDHISGSSSSISIIKSNGLLTPQVAGGSKIFNNRNILITWANGTSGISTASINPHGNYGGTTSVANAFSMSVGGAGYGAGGGGYTGGGSAIYSYGGNSGVISFTCHALTSTSSIAITVGNGGAGHGNAGGGARGCVAVYW